MEIKLIALDLDDTLVDHEKDLSKRDLDAIKKAQEKGIYICLASGRTFKSMKRFYERLALDTLSISTGGAIINDKDGKRVYTKYLPRKEAAKIVKYAHKNGHHAQVYFNDDFYYYKESKFADLYGNRIGLKGIYDKSLLQLDEIGTPKILFIDEVDNIAKLTPILKKQFPNIAMKNSYPDYIEVNHKDANKGEALKELAKMLGIKKENIMAIGDSEIDLCMIKYAGVGVCVENGAEHVKQNADFITASCKNDGVAVAIEKFVFKK